VKKLLIGFLVFVVVAVVAAVAIAPRVIPTAEIVAKIADQVEASTGRKLQIKGPVTLSLLPHIALDAEDVSLGNAPGFEPADQATLAKLTIRVAFWPLLGGKLAIETLELDSPRIELASNGPGKNNWTFTKPAAESVESAPAKTAAPAEGKSRMVPGLVDISLGDIRIEKGTLVFTDVKNGQTRELDNIDATLSLPDLEAALTASANVVYNKQKVIVKFGVAKTGQLLAGEPSPITLNINSNPIKGSFSGNATLSEGLDLSGDVTLNVPSLRDLAIWGGIGLPASQGGLGPLSIKGKLERAGSQLSFNGAEIALDAIKGTGDVQLDTKGGKPLLKGKLDVDQLDLNPYVTAAAAKTGDAKPAEAKAPEPKADDAKDPAPEAAAGWSQDPIDLSALSAFDADFTFQAKGILYHAIKVGESTLNLQIKDGKATADLVRTALYDGTGKGKIVLDGSKPTPAVAIAFNLAGVDSGPLLTDATGFDRVSGKATGDIVLAGTGQSEREIIGSLEGKGAFKLANGSVRGINLGSLIKMTSGLTDAAAQAAESTDFSEASFTFTVAKGIVKNQDLTLKSPSLVIAGAGQVDLLNRTVDYRLDPRSGADAKGSILPVLVRGPFTHLTYQPDIQALVQNPAAAVKNAKEAVKNILGTKKKK